MKIYTLAIITLLQAIVLTSCGEGCLRCGEGNACLLCDTQNGYYYQPDTQSCQFEEIMNCQIYDSFKNCIQCSTGLYYNKHSRECLTVSIDLLDTFCQHYDTDQTCKQCIPGYVKKSNACSEVIDQIENCLYYQEEGVCKECEEDYTLALDQTNCIENPNVDFCQYFSVINCQDCPSGFQVDLNQTKINYQNLILNQTFLNQNSQIQSLDNFVEPINQTCAQDDLEHCLEFQDSSTCQLCHDEYQQYQGLCYIPSFTQINNCLLYGYIDTTSICIKCTSDYYLLNQVCTLRTNNAIDECMTYSIDLDTCNMCNDTFQVTSDGLQCLEEIDNCKVHTLNGSGDAFECDTCNDGYYLNGATCTLGTVDNCMTYQQDADVCEVCMNQYYLQGSMCRLHTNEILNCEVYGKTQLNTCEQCNIGFKKMTVEEFCLEGSIENCKYHESQDVCAQCNDDYRLATNGECLLADGSQTIDSQQNWQPIYDDLPNTCNSGELPKGSNCQIVYQYEIENCAVLDDTIGSDNIQNQQCNICNNGSIPYNLQDHFTCPNEDELKSIFDQATVLVDDCQTYGIVSGNVECIQCNLDFILDSNSCNDNCPAGQMKFNQKLQIDSDMVTYKLETVCVDEIVGVETLVQDNELNQTPYELEDGYHYKIKLQNQDNLYKIIEPSQINTGTITSMDLFKLPLHQEIIQVPSDQQISNCFYYQELIQNEFECAVCDFKFHSEAEVIQLDTENCNQFASDGTCQICQDGYIQSVDRTQCTESLVDNCIQYESNTANCQLCDVGYFRDSLTSCQINTITNCEIENEFQDTCLKCNDGLYEAVDNNGDIILCETPIANCIDYLLDGNTLKCQRCDLYHYPSIDQLSCIEGTINPTNPCIVYDQTQQDVCQYYLNNTLLNVTQQCIDEETIYGCLTPNVDVTDCDQCDIDFVYYANEQLCCDLGTYPLSTDTNQAACTGTQTNCLIWEWNGTSYECSQCQSSNQLDPNENQCCPVNQQFIDGQCQTTVEFDSSNVLECGLFDFENFICLGCSFGSYLSNNKCCPFTEYNNNGTCDDISNIDASLDTCNQIADDMMTCLQCADPNTEILIYQSSGLTICDTKPANMNCSTFITGSNLAPTLQCTECINDTYYLVEGNFGCCLKQTTIQSGQFWDLTANSNMGGCVDVTTEIDQCEGYDQNQDCISCQEVSGVQYFLSLEDQCCQSEFLFIDTYTSCTPVSTLYQNCREIDNFSPDTCSVCNVNFYKSNGICIQEGQYFPIDTDQTFNAPIDQSIIDAQPAASTNCSQLSDDKASCVQCNDGFRKVPPEQFLCCANNEQYNSGNSSCEPIPNYDPNTIYEILGSVTGCVDGYYLDNDYCCADDAFHVDGQCITKSVMLQNCIDFNYQTNQCLECDETAYLNFGLCCQNEQYHLENPLQCIDFPTPNFCAQGTLTNCSVCINDGSTTLIRIQLANTNPTQFQCIEPNPNCINYSIIDGVNICQECIEAGQIPANDCCQEGFAFNNGNCIEVPDNCAEYTIEDNTVKCTTCDTSFVLTNDNCCSSGKFFDGIICRDLPNNCTEAIFEDNKVKCTECDQTGNQLQIINDGCCELSQYFDQSICKSLQAQCTKVSYTNDDFLVCEECDSDFFAVNKTCCSDGQYYNGTQCINIDATHPCKQGLMIDGIINCLLCDDDSIPTTNNCCASGEVYDGIQCVATADNCNAGQYWTGTDCRDELANCQTQITDSDGIKQCEACESTDQNGNILYLQNGGCCQEGTYYIGQSTCVTLPNDCLQGQYQFIDTSIDTNVYQYTNLQCLTCNTGYLTGGRCCPQNQYWDGTTCSSLPQNCSQGYSEEGFIICESCSNGATPINGTCCSSSQYQNIFVCINLPTNCTDAYFDNSNNTICRQCDTGFYLSDSRCCQLGQYYNNGSCTSLPSDCLQGFYNGTSIECTVCNDDIIPINGSCCGIGNYINDSSCDSLPPLCTYGQALSSTTFECTDCQDDAYVTENRCCYEGQYFDTTGNSCLFINQKAIQNSINCLDYNVVPIQGKYQCQQCNTDYYLVKQFEIDGGNLNDTNLTACCQNNQTYSFEKQSCEDFNDIEKLNTTNVFSQCDQADIIFDGGISYAYCSQCTDSTQQIQITQSTASFSIGTSSSTCTTPLTNYEQCKVLLLDNTNTVVRCLKCFNDSTHYLGLKNCCEKGTLTNSVQSEQTNGQCQEDNSSNCAEFDIDKTCIRCIDTHFLQGTNCITIVNSDNITNCEVSFTGTCYKCDQGFYLSNPTTCLSLTSTNTALNSCSADSSQNCLYCYNNQVLTNDACCSTNSVFINSVCKNIFLEINWNSCLQQENDSCTLCDNANSYYGIENSSGNIQCCLVNFTLNDSDECINASGESVAIQDCNVFEDKTTCRQLTDQEKIDGDLQEDCKNSKYFTNGACCADYSYFDGTSCIGITQLNCVQFTDECIQCDANYTLIGGSCIQNFNNCDLMENSTTCSLCQDSYYISDGHCCQDEFVYNNGSCEQISTSFNVLVDCIQIEDPQTAPIQCSKCDSTKILTNGNCCDSDEYYDININSCIDNSVLENCADLNNDLSCNTCKENHYFTSQMCCPFSQSFDQTNNICTNISDPQCQQVDDSDICIVCQDGFYINPITTSSNKCCINSMKPNSTNCKVVDPSENVEGCIDFNSSDDCIECSDDYVLQNNICCQKGHVLFGNDNTFDKCLNITTLYDNCDQFDPSSLLCSQCKDGYYRLTSQLLCCLEGQHFDTNTYTCQNNTNNCNQQEDNNCVECNTNFYLVGTDGQQTCCANGQYFNTELATPACVNIDITDCQQAEIQTDTVVCTQCGNFKILNTTDNTCDDSILNCAQTGFDSNNNIVCEECSSGFILSNDQILCCQENSFFLDSLDPKCSTTLLITDTQCATIDTSELQCSSCGSGKYLSDGICCDFGTFKQPTDTILCTGDITLSNCNAQINNTCTQCQDGYQLNSSDQCIEIIDNCIIFDADTPQCIKCQDDYYITNDQCCLQGQVFTSGSCTSITIDNCLQQADGATPECDVCDSGFYVNSDDICCSIGNHCTASGVETLGLIENCLQYGTDENDCTVCSSDYSLTQILDEEDSVSNIQVCIEYSIQDCLISNINPSDNSYTCSQCIDGKETDTMPLIQVSQDVIINEVDNCQYYDIKDTLDNSSLQCSKCDDTHYLNSSNECIIRVANYDNCLIREVNLDLCDACELRYTFDGSQCQEFDIADCEIAFNATECQQCNAGFILIGDINTLENYVCTDESTIPDYSTAVPIEVQGQNGCVDHSNCSNEYLNGLEPEVSKFLTCHVCNDTDKIPFVSLQIDYDTQAGNQLFNGLFQNQQLIDLNFTKNSECLLSDLSELNLPSSSFMFPDNCGVGIINGEETLSLNQTDQSNINTSTDELSIFCGACKPGFKPTYSNLNYHIIQCEEITNCQTSGSAFNQCDMCEDGYAFQYVNDQEFIKDTCVEVTQDSQVNCYAYDDTNDMCIVCEQGYVFNIEGICEELDIPKCQAGMNNDQVDLTINDLQLVYYKGIKGCQQCQNTYYRFQQEIEDQVCLVSPYEQGNDFIENESFLMENCYNYGFVNNDIKCILCDEGYLIDINNQCQEYVDEFVNCKIAQDENTCNECLDNFNFNQDGLCLEIPIIGCKIFTDNENCAECYFSYERKQNPEGNYYCVDPLKLSSCTSADTSLFLTNTYNCETCSTNHFLSDLDISQDICVPLLSIDGCINYADNVVDFNAFTACLECDSMNYYLQDDICILRENKDENCMMYQQQQDECMQCKQDYYLVDNNTKCQIAIEFIQDCDLYGLTGDCIKCNIENYLMNNQCPLLQVGNEIDNCIEYDENQMCINCEDDYQLFNGICYLQEMEGCKVYDGPNSCSECMEGFCNIVSGGNLICEEKYNVFESRIDTGNDETNWLQHYCKGVLGSFCNYDAIFNKVENCAENFNGLTCSQCDSNYYLSLDKDECLPIDVQFTCSNLQINREPQCMLCQDGYKLNEDYECVIDDDFLIGCLVPDQNDVTQCEICQPGYYMEDDTQVCVEGDYNISP